jgi:hypothetical protein
MAETKTKTHRRKRRCDNHLGRSRGAEGVMLYLGFIAVYLAPHLFN